MGHPHGHWPAPQTGPQPGRSTSNALVGASREKIVNGTLLSPFVPLTIFLALYTSGDISARQASHLANVYEIQVAWDGMLER